jgi:hypothetical protein
LGVDRGENDMQTYRTAQTDWTGIGQDLELCDLIEAFGTPANKRKARKHRAAIMAHIRAENERDGPIDLDALRDELADLA